MTTRREQILGTAAELFAARGFHGVSVADLGAACGISGLDRKTAKCPSCGNPTQVETDRCLDCSDRSAPDAPLQTVRHTLCSKAKSPIGRPMYDYPTTKEVAAELPGPTPRDVVTVFEFVRTTQRMAESGISLTPDAELLPQVVARVLP